MHPLLNPTDPIPFSRPHNGTRLSGLVFSQYQNQHRKAFSHPHLFYVEFPANDPSSVHEVDARRTAAILGDGGIHRSFDRLELARTMERLPSSFDLMKLLPNLHP